MCVFCEIYQKEKEKIIAENNLAFAIFDAYPVNPGHSLIIPKRHYPDFFQSTVEEISAIYDLLQKVKKILDEKYHPDGYNVGVNIGETAGQTVFHLHVHLIPRFKGDVENPRGGVRNFKNPLVEYK
ncbi:HIT family hydrolase [Carboxydothermus islandicus]|uniref:HIT family hydrolase n=1 Tax=Carboxydothermus islandicus TaxID=661089 RepID=A0A1L8D256_9THEO|nr:HIT family protein [Carboxydothermus islandicus]GAV25194.1 HIT family hydrolase [Carboxydothermus islandicus]